MDFNTGSKTTSDFFSKAWYGFKRMYESRIPSHLKRVRATMGTDIDRVPVGITKVFDEAQLYFASTSLLSRLSPE